MSNDNNKRLYNMAVRMAVIVGTLVAMYISATFSKDGFAFEMGGYGWMGWALSALCIVIQLYWNRMEGDKGLTIYVVGMSIYGYSIYTNFVGVSIAQVGDGWVFPLLFSLILDILPEPFFVMALAGIVSDPLGKAVEGMGRIIDSSSTTPRSGVKTRKNPISYQGKKNTKGYIDTGFSSQIEAARERERLERARKASKIQY